MSFLSPRTGFSFTGILTSLIHPPSPLKGKWLDLGKYPLGDGMTAADLVRLQAASNEARIPKQPI